MLSFKERQEKHPLTLNNNYVNQLLSLLNNQKIVPLAFNYGTI